MMVDSETQAVLSRSILEETGTTVRMHKGQELESGILPMKGGQQHRSVRVGGSSLIKGSILGKDVRVEAAENILLSDGLKAPGTEIHGSVNSLGSVTLGSGIWIRGGVIATGDVNVEAFSYSDSVPQHVLIEGGVSGRNVTIGDGVVILGPVLAIESLTIGNNVTIRDHVRAEDVKMGDGCLIGGLQVKNSFSCGKLTTIASSQILLPVNPQMVSIDGQIRSPYPGCNNCPEQAFFSNGSEIPRKLSCHYFAERNDNEVVSGTCNEWTPFPLFELDKCIEFSELKLISNIPINAVNLDQYAEDASIWERGGEL